MLWNGWHCIGLQADGDLAMHIDISPLAVEVYGENHENPVLCGNIQDPKDILRLFEGISGKRCGLAAGFPCPPFSTRGDQRGFNDARAMVFVDCLNTAFLFKSLFVVLECTPATGKWIEVEELLASFSTAMGFARSHGILHLHHTWPCFRTRWWTVMAPGLCGPFLPPLRDLPVLPLRCVNDVIPIWPVWPPVHERHLQWTSEELAEYEKYTDIADVLLHQNGVAPTLLHSCGHHFHPCPCGCRAHGLSALRLQRDGISVVAVRSTSDPSLVRHLHPTEAAYLCTVPLSFKFPTQNLRAGLPLIGQIAAPAQAHWVFLQLRVALHQAGLHCIGQELSIDEHHLHFVERLLTPRLHVWAQRDQDEHFQISLRQDEDVLAISVKSGSTVGHLLAAHRRLADWSTRCFLTLDGATLSDDTVLRPLTYDLYEYRP